MKQIVLACAFVIMLTNTVYAEKMYVGNILKVTLRTGPGLDHKVIQMLESGQEVDVLEPGKDWSRVLTMSGNEGWILTRFISPQMPSDLLLKNLSQKYEKLSARAADLEKENAKFLKENKQLASELADTKDALSRTSNEYSTLKKESADFLSLKAKYEKANLELATQTNKARELNEILLQRNIHIGLLGAGILLVGFIIGFSTKKQRRRSSLL
ncbi:MAG: TIGR04211 family SH3 domain-containing protein [Desulfobacterales bacterium]